MRKNKKAFTLIELIIVIAILGILSAILVVSLSGSIDNAKVANGVANAKNMSTKLQAYLVNNPISSIMSGEREFAAFDSTKIMAAINEREYDPTLSATDYAYATTELNNKTDPYYYWLDEGASPLTVVYASVSEIAARAGTTVDYDPIVPQRVFEGFTLLDYENEAQGGNAMLQAFKCFYRVTLNGTSIQSNLAEAVGRLESVSDAHPMKSLLLDYVNSRKFVDVVLSTQSTGVSMDHEPIVVTSSSYDGQTVITKLPVFADMTKLQEIRQQAILALDPTAETSLANPVPVNFTTLLSNTQGISFTVPSQIAIDVEKDSGGCDALKQGSKNAITISYDTAFRYNHTMTSGGAFLASTRITSLAALLLDPVQNNTEYGQQYVDAFVNGAINENSLTFTRNAGETVILNLTITVNNGSILNMPKMTDDGNVYSVNKYRSDVFQLKIKADEGYANSLIQNSAFTYKSYNAEEGYMLFDVAMTQDVDVTVDFAVKSYEIVFKRGTRTAADLGITVTASSTLNGGGIANIAGDNYSVMYISSDTSGYTSGNRYDLIITSYTNAALAAHEKIEQPATPGASASVSSDYMKKILAYCNANPLATDIEFEIVAELSLASVEAVTQFAEDVKAGNVGMHDAILMSSTVVIDLTNESTDWTPIGTVESPFMGTFHGNGATFENLTVSTANNGYIGLFGYVGPTATITGITLKNVTVTVEEDVYGGLLAGFVLSENEMSSLDCKLTNCTLIKGGESTTIADSTTLSEAELCAVLYGEWRQFVLD